MLNIHEPALPINRCFVCLKRFKTHRTIPSDTHKGLYETVVKAAHARCQRLQCRRTRAIQCLTNVEYEIYLSKM